MTFPKYPTSVHFFPTVMMKTNFYTKAAPLGKTASHQLRPAQITVHPAKVAAVQAGQVAAALVVMLLGRAVHPNQQAATLLEVTHLVQVVGVRVVVQVAAADKIKQKNIYGIIQFCVKTVKPL